MSAARTITFQYGNFSTGVSDWIPIGIHSVSEDRDTFEVQFDVLQDADTTANLKAREDALKAELNKRNQRCLVILNSQTLIEFDPNAVGSNWEGASETQASYRTIDEFELRSETTRAYRITVSGAKTIQSQALRASSILTGANWSGKRAMSVQVGATPEGLRSFTLTATFVPDGTRDAQEVAEDGTLGFVALVGLVQTALGGTWDNAEPQITRDPEDRFATYVATYDEILFGQSEDATSDATLVGAQYAVFHEQQATQSIAELQGTSLLRVRCVFSSGVRSSVTTDLGDVIQNKALPRCRVTVARALGATGTLIELRNSLQGNKSENTIAGTVDYLAVIGGSVLNAVKGYQDEKTEGREFLEVADGNDYTVDEHLFSPRWFRRVQLAIEEVGTYGPSVESYVSPNLTGLIQLEIDAQEAEGFAFLGLVTGASEGVSRITGAGWTRIVSTVTLSFRRVEILFSQEQEALAAPDLAVEEG